MPSWMLYSLLAVLSWGIIGLFQKIGASRISEASLLAWLLVGLLLLMPWLLVKTDLRPVGFQNALIGFLAGTTNGLGLWFLFAAFKNGAKASVAVPLTALNPLLTIVFAFLFLAERLTVLQCVGVVLALISGAMISYEKNSQVKTPIKTEDGGNANRLN
jgi:bacterial/archaeal transporter family protein